MNLYNEREPSLLLEPHLWESSSDVLFLHRQLDICHNRLQLLHNTDYDTSLLTEQINKLESYLSKLYDKKTFERNQFM